MATKYTFYFSDTSKTDFSLYPYTANGPVSPSDDNPIAQAVTRTTTLKLYGKGMQDYGEGIEQNMIYMLENFSNSTRPVRSIEGQLWYNNVGLGSPPTGIPELFMRNTNPSDVFDTTEGGDGWDAVILATGSSPMKDELILSGTPTNVLAAVPLQYVDNHIADNVKHISSDQNDFLDALALPTLTAAEVNYLVGVGSPVQPQIDFLTSDKISRTGDSMNSNTDLTFAGGGEVLGLPATPSATGATSKEYVDSLVASGVGGDGVLNQTTWITGTGGSPTPVISDTTLEFTILYPNFSTATLTAEGISREGHTHLASEIPFDNTGSPALSISGPNIQAVIEDIDLLKAPKASPVFTGSITAAGGATFGSQVSAAEPVASNHLTTKNYVDNIAGGGSGGGTVTTSVFVVRNLETLSTTLTTPTPYEILAHTVDDNKVSISINGIKQFAHTHGLQRVTYDPAVGLISNDTYTGLDASGTYDFAIDVDGSGPVTVTISSGSAVVTHGSLIATINNLMTGGSPDLAAVLFELEGDDLQKFTAFSSGGASSITVSDPLTANPYLFATDPSATAIIGANFLSEPTMLPTSTPDDLIFAGDVTALFPINKSFTVRGSSDATYGNYDSVYRVHANGPVFDTTNTLVPIAWVGDSTLNVPLLGAYIPSGSPSPTPPAPSPWGDVYFTTIGGFLQLETPINGTTGDYAETDIVGNVLPAGQLSSYVTFNYTIPSGNQIENVLLV